MRASLGGLRDQLVAAVEKRDGPARACEIIREVVGDDEKKTATCYVQLAQLAQAKRIRRAGYGKYEKIPGERASRLPPVRGHKRSPTWPWKEKPA